MSGYQRLGGYGAGQERTGEEHQNPFEYPQQPDPRYHDRSPSPLPHPQMDPRYQLGPPPLGGQEHYPNAYQMQPMDAHRPPPGEPLDIPMGPGPHGGPADRLQMQPTYSVENVHNSYGHNDAYEAHQPMSAHPGHDYPPHSTGDISLHPDAHHDAYYNQPYQPHPSEDPFNPGGHSDPYFHDEPDTRPILPSGGGSYGPDPHSVPTPMEEVPMNGGEYMDKFGNIRPTPSPAPIKRYKTVKEVQLFEGNLVLDCPVPPRLLNQIDHLPAPARDEYTHMRYSAVTGDPSEFHQKRFRLRQQLFSKPRHTELFICITMYNEEDELFARTMIGVIKNIEYMNSRNSSKTWGKEAWKKIVVCVVSDGRAKINPRTRGVLAAMGLYQEGIAKQKVMNEDVTAHVYEYTSQMTLEIKKGIVNVKKGNTPIQMMFCLKEKNQKKINSHRWFFQAFGSVLNPNICVLIDAGTRPGKDSVYQLWKAFDLEPMCAGACGEIKAMLEGGKQLLNPLVAAQNFEYKISNILDKPLESVFGFISVLPGAFSAYRFVALQNDKTGQGPLEKYFAGEKMHGANAGIFTANMYLAEDRILCFELVAKRNCHWILQYVKSAEGATDVPTEMADFILQRRRWLNGSFFAAVYATTHFYQIFRSKHGCFRIGFFLFEFFYQFVNQLFAWFAIGNFFLVFRILTTSLSDKALLGTAGRILAVVFEWLYLVTLVTCFVLALGNRPQGSNRFYMTMVYFWVVLMVYLMFAAVFVTVKAIQQTITASNGHFTAAVLLSNGTFQTLILSLVATYVLYFTMSFLFFDPWHMFTSFIQYLLLTPTYINILNVYAFCNTHDITWGTKGDTTAPKLDSVSAPATAGGAITLALPDSDHDLNTQYENELRVFAAKYKAEKKKPSEGEKQEDYYKGFRSAVVLVWMFCNLALCAAVLSTGGFDRLEGPQTPGQRRMLLSRDLSTSRYPGAGIYGRQSGLTSGTGAATGDSSSAKGGVGSTTDSSHANIIDTNSLIYMRVILWSVAGLSLVRWVGSLWFLVVRLLRGV